MLCIPTLRPYLSKSDAAPDRFGDFSKVLLCFDLFSALPKDLPGVSSSLLVSVVVRILAFVIKLACIGSCIGLPVMIQHSDVDQLNVLTHRAALVQREPQCFLCQHGESGCPCPQRTALRRPNGLL
jgi:hypothetical protein